MRKVFSLLMVMFFLSVICLPADAAEYVVQTGDSLWSIASKNGTTVSSLKSLNNLSSDTIKSGQRLTLPGETTANTTTSTSTPTTVSSYTVKTGDTLWAISQRLGLSVETLKKMNNLQSDALRPGMILQVSGQLSRSGDRTSREDDTTSPSRGDVTRNVISQAVAFVGTPYSYGGNGPSSFDCSGFVKYVFATCNVSLPRTSIDQSSVGVSVSRDDLKVLDLVFFKTGGSSHINHVGICLGGDKFIHASSHGVEIDNLNSAYYAECYSCARRVIG